MQVVFFLFFAFEFQFNNFIFIFLFSVNKFFFRENEINHHIFKQKRNDQKGKLTTYIGKRISFILSDFFSLLEIKF